MERANAVVILVLATYVAGFVLFRPKVITVTDEGMYIAQAVTFSRGHMTQPVRGPFGVQNALPSLYPVGTSLLQTPLVRMWGWTAAPWASVLCLVGAVLILAKWLGEAGYNPGFALLFVAYPATLIFGRIAMSELPSALVATLGWWMFWRGLSSRHPGWWLGAGGIAALSILFREPNCLLFLPFFIGAVIRDRLRSVWLVLGGVAGACIALLISWPVFGTPFFWTRRVGVSLFSVAYLKSNVPLYVFALLVLIPGGLLSIFFYRGQRKQEVATTIVLVLAFYCVYFYSGVESGALKRLVLGPRYFVPLLPLLAFAAAEWMPRLLPRSQVVTSSAVAGVFVVAFAVHPLMERWSRAEGSIVEAIYSSTPPGAAIVENRPGTAKYINSVYGDRVWVDRDRITAAELPRIAQRHPTYIIFVDQSRESAYRFREMQDNDVFLSSAERICAIQPVRDTWYDAVTRLRIFQVGLCGNGGSNSGGTAMLNPPGAWQNGRGHGSLQ